MKKAISLIIILIAAVSTMLIAQESPLRSADTNYELLKFYDAAIPYYKEHLVTAPKDAKALARLGDCYFRTNNMVESERNFNKAFSLDINQTNHFVMQYGETYQALGEYAKAKKWFEVANTMNIKEAKSYVNACNYALTHLNDAPNFEIKAEPGVNSSSCDFAPTFYKNSIIFGSSRKTKATSTTSSKGKEAITELFKANRNEDGSLAQAVSLRGDLSKFDESPVAFSGDGSEIVISNMHFREGIRLNGGAEIRMRMELAPVKNQSSWGPEAVFPFNGVEASTGQAALSADGKTLYFSSNMSGGFGGYDIYVSYKKDNAWSAPVNLGSDVNTSGNEMTPFISTKNQLFFSSDGHAGFGGFDIYMATLQGSKGKNVTNLGPPLNSSYDDTYFIFDDAKQQGYFVSNRPNGKGGDDIYSCSALKTLSVEQPAVSNDKPAKLPEVVVAAVPDKDPAPKSTPSIPVKYEQGSKKTTKTYVGQVIDASSNKPLAGVELFVVNKSNNNSGKATTDENGEYSIVLTPSSTCDFLCTLANYENKLVTISLSPTSPLIPKIEMQQKNAGSVASTPTGGFVAKGGKALTGSGVGYNIRLGRYKNIDKTTLAKVAGYGHVITHKTDDQGTVYQLGIYATKEQATDLLPTVQKLFSVASIQEVVVNKKDTLLIYPPKQAQTNPDASVPAKAASTTTEDNSKYGKYNLGNGATVTGKPRSFSANKKTPDAPAPKPKGQGEGTNFNPKSAPAPSGGSSTKTVGKDDKYSKYGLQKGAVSTTPNEEVKKVPIETPTTSPTQAGSTPKSAEDKYSKYGLQKGSTNGFTPKGAPQEAVAPIETPTTTPAQTGSTPKSAGDKYSKYGLQNGSVTAPAKEAKTVIPKPAAVLFKIQLGAYKDAAPTGQFSDISSIGDLEAIPGDKDKIYYYLGHYESIDEAKKAHLKVKQAGYNGTFLVAFKNGVKMSVSDALKD